MAESYGRLAARVVEAGRQPRIQVLDPMIAATAHEAKPYIPQPGRLRSLEDQVEVISL